MSKAWRIAIVAAVATVLFAGMASFAWPTECDRAPDGSFARQLWQSRIWAPLSGKEAKCDPWLIVPPDQGARRIEFYYLNPGWSDGKNPRKASVAADGQLAIYLAGDQVGGSWTLESVTIDRKLASALLASLSPLTRYDRDNSEALPSSGEITRETALKAPRVKCLYQVYDAGYFNIRTVSQGTDWQYSSISGGCGSPATEVAERRLSDAFVRVFEATGNSHGDEVTAYYPVLD